MQIGVVGCGYWGSKHLRVLGSIPHVENVVAIDASEDRLRAVAEAFPTATLARRLDDVLPRLDGLVVATPPQSHVALATQAIDAGCPVLVEKPLATKARDAKRLVDLADARSVPVMVGHTFEHNAAVWKLRELVRNDDLGPVYYADAARLNLGLYQSDVNVIWDLAPHDISIFNFVLSSTPSWVEAWGSCHAHPLLEDVAYVRLYYADAGVMANIHVSWLDPCKVRRVTLVGSHQMAVYNDLASEPLRIFDKGVEMLVSDEDVGGMPMSYRYGDILSPFVAAEEPLAVQDRRFVGVVMSRDIDSTNARNGVAVVEVLEAAERALREQRRVEVDEVRADGELAVAVGEAG
ncbi:MAG TPA: Gfo/Idh/MocA family oxidoreductase [Actinomycetota bacterium]|nr:Gfo/Idh/MocA family oxidoreductase [Actinomycetota bacterium]